MIFGKKVDRAMNWLKEQNSDNKVIQSEDLYEENNPKDEWMEKQKKVEIEKKDLPAMLIAAIIVFLPAILLFFAIILLISYLFV